ncbi:hypothetical protein LINPERHAP1_LOCUS39766, partial [Linum perenne]
DSEALWVELLQTKYFQEVGGVLQPRNLASQSGIWRGISRSWNVMLEGAQLGTRNGKYTYFSIEDWLDSGARIIDVVVDPDESIDTKAKVFDFVQIQNETDVDQWIRGVLEYDRVATRVDSQVVLALINSKEELTHQHAGEILTIRRLLQRDWEVTFSRTNREGNKAADYLASCGHNLLLGTHNISVSNCNLGYFLRHDCELACN